MGQDGDIHIIEIARENGVTLCRVTLGRGCERVFEVGKEGVTLGQFEDISRALWAFRKEIDGGY